LLHNLHRPSDGLNAFSVVDGGATLVPAYSASVDLPLVDPPGSQWIGLGQVIYIASFGYFRVDAIVDDATVTIFNLGYTGNVNGNGILAFTAGARVQPGGLVGPTGAAPGGAFLIANNLSEGTAATMRTNLGLGTVATFDEGTANGEVPSVDDAGGITSGEAVFGTANGVESKTASAARTALGLGTMAVQDSNNVNITGGTISGITLGQLTGVPRDYLLFQNQQLTSVSGGSISSGGWVTVPLNTEVYDTGAHGSINAGTGVITLAAGTYRARWRVMCLKCDVFASRLRNITTPATFLGSNATAKQSDNSSAESQGEARFTVTAGSTIVLEAQVTTTNLADGFGEANLFGATEVYQSLELVKEI
jgi:hypothetical protein